MFGKFMNSYYYGKAGKGDYGKDDLPKNRWQLFLEMLRVRFAGLFRMNIMTLVAWLPVMYVLARLVSGLLNIAGLISEVELDMAAATADQLEVYKNRQPLMNGIILQHLLWLVPAVAITGPFQAGMAYVTRNWARDEHAFVWSDFKDAFLQNWKQALPISLITGLVPLVIFVSYQFYGQMAGRSLFFVVPQMLSLVLGLVWMLGLVFFYPLMVTYKLSFRTLLKNGLLLALGRLPHVVGLRLAMLVPTLLVVLIALMTPYAIYALMGLAGYYLLLGNALARFVYASFSNAVFDRFINPHVEGAQVGRGLSTEEEDDDEELDEPALEAPKAPPGSEIWDGQTDGEPKQG